MNYCELPIELIEGLPEAESGILEIFQELTAQYGFQQDEISYQNPREDSFCLKKDSNEKWVLFYYERGQRHNQIILSSALEGCFEILDRTIINQNALETIKSVFTTVILLEKKELGIRLPNYITKYLIKHGREGYRYIKIKYKSLAPYPLLGQLKNQICSSKARLAKENPPSSQVHPPYGGHINRLNRGGTTCNRDYSNFSYQIKKKKKKLQKKAKAK